MKLTLLLSVLLVFVQVKWIVAATDDTHGGKDQLHQMRHLLEDPPFHSKGFSFVHERDQLKLICMQIYRVSFLCRVR